MVSALDPRQPSASFCLLAIGPDPRGALHIIDRLGLYPTIFANHQDDVSVDTSTWPLAYNTLARIFNPSDTEESLKRIRRILLEDPSTHSSAWMIAAFAPWTSVPSRSQGKEKRPPPLRPVEVGRDSLKADNKTLFILRDATAHFEDIIACKNSLLQGTIQASAAEIRQQIGLRIRSWGKEWRLCVLLAILQEVMRGRDLSPGKQSISEAWISDIHRTDPILRSGRRIRPFLSICCRKGFRGGLRTKTDRQRFRNYAAFGGQKRTMDEQSHWICGRMAASAS